MCDFLLCVASGTRPLENILFKLTATATCVLHVWFTGTSGTPWTSPSRSVPSPATSTAPCGPRSYLAPRLWAVWCVSAARCIRSPLCRYYTTWLWAERLAVVHSGSGPQGALRSFSVQVHYNLALGRKVGHFTPRLWAEGCVTHRACLRESSVQVLQTWSVHTQALGRTVRHSLRLNMSSRSFQASTLGHKCPCPLRYFDGGAPQGLASLFVNSFGHVHHWLACHMCGGCVRVFVSRALAPALAHTCSRVLAVHPYCCVTFMHPSWLSAFQLIVFVTSSVLPTTFFPLAPLVHDASFFAVLGCSALCHYRQELRGGRESCSVPGRQRPRRGRGRIHAVLQDLARVLLPLPPCAGPDGHVS